MTGSQALEIVVGNKTPDNLPSYPNKGGRPTRVEVAGLAKLKKTLEYQIAKNSHKIAKSYIKFAQVDPPTTRHAVERVLPAARPDLSPGEVVLIAGVGAILEDYLRRKEPNFQREIDVSPAVSEVIK